METASAQSAWKLLSTRAVLRRAQPVRPVGIPKLTAAKSLPVHRTSSTAALMRGGLRRGSCYLGFLNQHHRANSSVLLTVLDQPAGSTILKCHSCPLASSQEDIVYVSDRVRFMIQLLSPKPSESIHFSSCLDWHESDHATNHKKGPHERLQLLGSTDVESLKRFWK